MQVKKILNLSLSLLALSSMTLAMAFSSSIPLDNARIEPGKTGKISLTKLYEGVQYSVDCRVHNERFPMVSKKNDILVDLLGQDTQTRPFEIDGKRASYRTVLQVNSDGSKLHIAHLRKQDEGFFIRNLDYSESIMVDQCIADLEKN